MGVMLSDEEVLDLVSFIEERPHSIRNDPRAQHLVDIAREAIGYSAVEERTRKAHNVKPLEVEYPLYRVRFFGDSDEMVYEAVEVVDGSNYTSGTPDVTPEQFRAEREAEWTTMPAVDVVRIHTAAELYEQEREADWAAEDLPVGLVAGPDGELHDELTYDWTAEDPDIAQERKDIEEASDG